MQPTILNLEKIIHNYARRLASMPDAVYAAKPQPDKWSKKEILGHLVELGPEQYPALHRSAI